jgi:DNA-binding NarL/FixJ family response regulator
MEGMADWREENMNSVIKKRLGKAKTQSERQERKIRLAKAMKKKGWPISQIAKNLNISESSVRTLLK